MSGSAVAEPAVDATLACLMSGEVFTGLVEDQAEERAARLDAVLRRFVDDSTRVAWVGNPLRSPLTIERFLLQIAGPEVDLRPERSPAELACLIASRSGSETRLLVVVQQPETINPQTIEELGAMAGYLGGEAVQVQFLFAGSRAFRLPTVTPPLELAPLLPILPVLPPPEPEPEAVAAGSRRRDVLPLALLLIVTVLGAIVSLWPPEQVLDAAIVRDFVEPPRTATSSAAPTDDAALRRQFDTFLASRTALPPLSDAQKDALFNEFLAYRRRE